MNPTLPLEQLESKHPEHILYMPLYREIDDLAEGGMVLQNNLDRYLIKKPGEDRETYEYRKKIFSYEPVLAQCFSEFVNLFLTSTYTIEGLESDQDFWDVFRQSTNKSKRNELSLIRESLLHLLKYRHVWAIVDQSPTGTPYITLLDPKDIIHFDSVDGELQWVKFRQIKPNYNPFGETTWFCEWVIITKTQYIRYGTEIEKPLLDENNGYKITLKSRNLDSSGLQGSKTQEVPLIDFYDHKYLDIPVIHAEIPMDLWTSSLSIHLVREHLRIHNNLSYAANIAGVIQRLYKPYKETADQYVDTSEILSQLQTGNETIIIGDDYRYIEAGGSSIVTVGDYLDKLEQKIKSIIFSNGIQPGRERATQESGRARRMDFINQEAALRAIGGIIQPWLQSLYRLVAWVKGIDEERINQIYIRGLEDFSLDAPDSKLDRLLSISTLPFPVPNEALELLMRDFLKSLFPGLHYNTEKLLMSKVKEQYKDKDYPSLDSSLLMALMENGMLPPDKVLVYLGFKGQELDQLKEFLVESLTSDVFEELNNLLASQPEETTQDLNPEQPDVQEQVAPPSTPRGKGVVTKGEI